MVWPFTRRKTKAKAAARLTPSLSYVDATQWAAGPSGAGTQVNAISAEALAATVAAVSAISGTIASLPAAVVRSDDSRDAVPGHPLQRLIDNGPNDAETWTDFLETLVGTCVLQGNALAEIRTNDRGELRELVTLPWPSVTPLVTDDGSLVFDFLPMVPPDAGKRRRLARADVLFVKDRSDDGRLGRARISRAALSMQSAINLQRQSQQFFMNLSRPAGTLTAPGRVSAETAARLQRDWDENYRGERLGKTAILGDGLTWQKVGLFTAEDSQLIDATEFSVADIARVFSVPAFLLGQSDKASTFASSREAVRFFAQSCLAPWCRRIERAFQQTVLSPQYRLQLDLDSLIRADVGELYSALLKARQGGWISPNDAREETGWPRVEGADSLEPPVAGGRAPSDAPPADDTSGDAAAGKIFGIGGRRA